MFKNYQELSFENLDTMYTGDGQMRVPDLSPWFFADGTMVVDGIRRFLKEHACSQLLGAIAFDKAPLISDVQRLMHSYVTKPSTETFLGPFFYQDGTYVSHGIAMYTRGVASQLPTPAAAEQASQYMI